MKCILSYEVPTTLHSPPHPDKYVQLWQHSMDIFFFPSALCKLFFLKNCRYVGWKPWPPIPQPLKFLFDDTNQGFIHIFWEEGVFLPLLSETIPLDGLPREFCSYSGLPRDVCSYDGLPRELCSCLLGQRVMNLRFSSGPETGWSDLVS